MLCGVDLGTTSIKISLCSYSGDVIHTLTQDTNSDVEEVPMHYHEQNPKTILRALKNAFRKIHHEAVESIDYLAVTGQMHGVIQWSSFHPSINTSEEFDNINCSNLVTWQDKRVTYSFISTLPNQKNVLSLHPGYGLGTLIYNQKHSKSHYDSELGDQVTAFHANDCNKFRYQHWGSIMDFVVWMLIGQKNPLYKVSTSAQIAHSFGYFDVNKNSFDQTSLELVNFDVNSLPIVVSEQTVLGTVTCPLFGLPSHCKVLVPYGDTQCALYSVIKTTLDTHVLNMGTSCQLAKLSSREDIADKGLCNLQSFPYFDNILLTLAASLNGGNVIKHFITNFFEPFASKISNNMKNGTVGSKGHCLEESAVYSIIIEAGIKEFLRSKEKEENLNPQLEFEGNFFAERLCSIPPGDTVDSTATLNNITSDNFTLGQISLALHRHVILNVRNMFIQNNSAYENGCCEFMNVVVVGNIFRKNKLFFLLVKDIFPTCTISELADSSIGAARYAMEVLSARGN